MMETSIFVKTMGNSSMARVVKYLITCRGLPVHQSDVIRNSNVSKVTVIRIWDEMIKRGFLDYDRAIGRAKLYRLNTENPAVKKLIELYNICLKQEVEEGLKESMVEIPV
ncbi:MAG: hypothetical protein ABIB47_04825 [Candidatus Woesearchaeota archaeon]